MLNGSTGTFTFGRAASPASFAITHGGANQAFFHSGSDANVTYHGHITRTAGAGWIVDVFQGGGSIQFQNGTLSATSGGGILLNNADGTVGFSGSTTLSGPARVRVGGGSSGAISFTSGTRVTNPTGANVFGLDVENGGAATSVSFGGRLFSNANRPVRITGVGSGTVTVSDSVGSTGEGILVNNSTAGTITFSGPSKVLNTGANPAVTLTSNNDATVTFSGGGLAITTTSGAGFSATGGGTINVTGAANTVNSTGGGTAVSIQNTTIGGSGMTFQRVDATGGGANGIVLTSTGAGTFQVTGDGASDSGNTTRGRTTARQGGGTITLGSGGTISGKSGDGVSLSSTGAVILRNMVIQNNSGDGVEETTATGVTIDNALVSGHTNNSGLFFSGVASPVIMHSEITNNAFGAGAPAADIHNVRLISNTGTGSVTHSVIANTSAGAERQLQIFSTSGTLNITVTNNRISGSTVGDGVGVYAFGSSNITASFQNDSIHNNSAFGIDSGTETTQSATLNITVNNSKFHNNFVGVTVAHGSSGTNTFNVTNNNFQNHGSISVNINRLGGGAFTSFGLFSGTVSGNTIGTAGAANSGSASGSPIRVVTNGNGGTSRVSILNNTIREYAEHGITVIPRDASSGHTLHTRIQSNNIANPHAFALDGVNVTMGALSSDVISLCLDIGGPSGVGGNIVNNSPRNGVRVRSSGLPAANVTLTAPGYDGTGATYFANRNPAATGASGNASFSNASGTTTAGTCTTP